MLAKCLKYDLKSVFKVWWIAAVTVLGLSIPTGLIFQMLRSSMVSHSYDSFGNTVLYLFIEFFTIAVYMCVVGFGILTSVLVHVRFYRHFFSDEGYLTFTLPVKRRTLLFSKILNAVIWNGATSAVLTVGSLQTLSLISSPDGQSSLLMWLFSFVGDVLKDGFQNGYGGWILLYVAEFLILSFLASFISYLWVYLCITVSSLLVRKLRWLLSIGLIYGTGQIVGVLYYVGVVILVFMSIDSAEVFEGFTEVQSYSFIAALLLLVCVVLGTVAVLLWNILLGSLERKLNLA